MQQLLQQQFDCEIDPAKLTFVRHHIAHAVSAYALSGFDNGLVMAIDGYGDFLSGLVAIGEGDSLREIETFPQSKSLGVLYLDVIQFLGYGSFDEYKVMGLAPYGDPAVFRPILRGLYELLPEGGYDLHLDRIQSALMGKIALRKKGEQFTQQHMDLAAALQEALEEIVMHVVSHRRHAAGQRNLCLAGGVAHNCTMNGKILYSGLFDRVFVQPASHDAGCALGAALYVSQTSGKPAPRKQMEHVYWGTNVNDEDAIAEELKKWDGLISFERSPNVAAAAAKLMADGYVLGWVQGQSEFGPRALGNRSILADPRPAENKGRINQMVKKREAYRPFAPSVLEEDAADFFDLPPGSNDFSFMVFVVNVREDKRELLGAITHVDGTARIQTVSRKSNPQYWNLIKAFKDLTGVPVLLNTSFNNNVEPIVNSVRDAVVSYLTTGLDYLVVGDFIARKRAATWEDRLPLEVSLPEYARIQQTRASAGSGKVAITCEMRTTFDSRIQVPISAPLCRLLMGLKSPTSIQELFHEYGIDSNSEKQALVDELTNLWAQRLVQLSPMSSRAAFDHVNGNQRLPVIVSEMQ
jgi:carbamoyltransferase